MTYTPLPNTGNVAQRGAQGLMPTYGTNLRDFSQLLDTNNALWIENYWVSGIGRLVKRKGTTTRFDTGDSDRIYLDKEFQNNFEIIGYGTKIRAYNTSTGTFTNIKTDFTGDNGWWSGDRAGDYFFVTNKVDGLWRISFTLPYSQSQNAAGQNKYVITATSGALGATITGATSGATATVVSSTGSLPGSLTVITTPLAGTFTHGEIITSGTLDAGASLTNINPFTVGAQITGATSGATGIVLEDSDAGATGTLTIGSITGTFSSGEIITTTGNQGRGLTTAATTFAITEIAAAPKAKYVSFIGDRILLLNLSTNPAGWSYSDRDTGSNPPFTNYTTASGFNSPGAGYYRNGKEGTGIAKIGDIIFLSFTKGWYAFQITQTEISGVSSKYDQEVQTSDLGIKNVFMTDVGLIACGEFGVKRLVSLGQPNVPYSEQWETLTEQLGEDYFTDVNFDDASIAYDEIRGYIYVSCAKGGGSTENFILAIKADLAGTETDVKTGAVSFFTGLNPFRFLKKDNNFYFTSSIDGISYNLFDGENDSGEEIYSEYYQELNFGTFTENFNLDEFKCEGELSPASSITVYFDTFDLNGYFQADRKNYTWTTSNSYTGGGGWGGSPWGSSGWGSGGTASGLVYSKARMKPILRNLTRVRARFVTSDTADHILALFSATSSVTAPTRNNTLAPN